VTIVGSCAFALFA